MSRTFSDSLDADLDVFFSTDEFAESVSITRASQTTSSVAAIVAERKYDALDAAGMYTAVQSRDFDFVATAYQIDSAQVTPAVGDRITDSNSQVFEVLPMAGGRHYEARSDGRIIRVHTKRVQ